jgi:hypothetical protein
LPVRALSAISASTAMAAGLRDIGIALSLIGLGGKRHGAIDR